MITIHLCTMRLLLEGSNVAEGVPVLQRTRRAAALAAVHAIAAVRDNDAALDGMEG